MARLQRNAFIEKNKPAIPAWPQWRDLIAGQPIVASYHPAGSEADPQVLVAAARAAHCRIALPALTPASPLIRFRQHDEGAPLEEGPFHILQPAGHAPALAPAVILLPLLAFTRSGIRLGQGGGHYDRAAAHWPDALRIGIAWSVQESAALPQEPWDMPLHAIATEREWITI